MEQLGQFRILHRIGAGGMGDVYLARDERLHRDVAIKVLPASGLSDTGGHARLLREARSAAALSHPHICVIHEVGEADGQAYIAMEYVDGDPLTARLVHGPLPPPEVIRYGMQLADALAHAHGRDVIHRDLKPANVIITPENRIKVLDFGLAKRLTDEKRSDATTRPEILLTHPGTVLGTPAYMAPEQLRGLPADARSDIWALGVMLHEMAMGVRPFDGRTWPELSAAILTSAPTPLPPAIPIELQSIIARCLAKEPGARYQRAGEVYAALEAIQTGVASARTTVAKSSPPRRRLVAAVTAAIALVAVLLLMTRERRPTPLPAGGGAPRIDSIGVLPLANLSGKPDQEYFADGMHSALIGELAKIGSLRVISRTSMMAYKGKQKSAPQIARELNIRGILEGSVARAGNNVRVQLQLIDLRGEERPVWTDTYEREVGQVFALHGDIARAVTRAIHADVTPSEEARLAKGRAVNPEIYEAYLRGMHSLNTMTPEGFQKGLAFFRAAVDKDPADPLPYAGLALAYAKMGHGTGNPLEDFPRAKAAAAKALKLDSTIPEAHEAVAEINLYWDWNLPAAKEGLQQVILLNPSIAEAHAHYAWYLVLEGKTDEAITEIKQAAVLDPLDATWARWYVGLLRWTSRQSEQAVREAKAVVALEPENGQGWAILALLQGMTGSHDAGIESAKRAARVRQWKWSLGLVYALAGRRDQALAVAVELEAKPLPIDAWGLAEIYGELGEKEKAIHWLQQAYDARWSWIPWMTTTPSFQSLYGDPRFEEMVRRLGPPVATRQRQRGTPEGPRAERIVAGHS